MGNSRGRCCSRSGPRRILGDVSSKGNKRSREELLQLLTEQRGALAASCENFDRGNQWEANRLATTVFNLVHDASKSITSLLTQLGLRSGLRFMSSGRVVDHEPNERGEVLAASTPPLVMINMSPGSTKFVARLHSTADAPEQTQSSVQFHRWWEDERIFKDWSGDKSLVLNRRRLVFGLRHQDGGAHIGALTDPAYVRFKAGAGWMGGAWMNGVEVVSPQTLMTEALAETMRQVAWEVTETLKQVAV